MSLLIRRPVGDALFWMGEEVLVYKITTPFNNAVKTDIMPKPNIPELTDYGMSINANQDKPSINLTTFSALPTLA